MTRAQPDGPATGEFEAELDAQVASALQRVRTADGARRHHDMANALTAVEGAGSILASDNISDVDRAKLGRLFGSGIDRLRALLDDDGQGAGPVPLAPVAYGVAAERRWYGLMKVDVAPDLVAFGRVGEITEAVRQLAACGHDLAPRGPLVLRGRRDGERVGLWLPAGAVDPSHTGLPIAFHVAARLVEDLGGETRVELGAAGARSIGLHLPAAGEHTGSHVDPRG